MLGDASTINRAAIIRHEKDTGGTSIDILTGGRQDWGPGLRAWNPKRGVGTWKLSPQFGRRRSCIRATSESFASLGNSVSSELQGQHSSSVELHPPAIFKQGSSEGQSCRELFAFGCRVD